MSIRLGNTEINKLYLGNTEISKAYLGSTLVFDNTSPTGTQLYTNEDAASPVGITEANTIVRGNNTSLGWENNGNTEATVSTTDSQVGDYAILLTAVGSNNTTLRFYYPIVTGNTYVIGFWAKSPIGTTQRLSIINDSPDINLSNISNPNWTYFEYTVESTATGWGQLLFYPSRFGTVGDTLLIDGLSILEN